MTLVDLVPCTGRNFLVGGEARRSKGTRHSRSRHWAYSTRGHSPFPCLAAATGNSTQRHIIIGLGPPVTRGGEAPADVPEGQCNSSEVERSDDVSFHGRATAGATMSHKTASRAVD